MVLRNTQNKSKSYPRLSIILNNFVVLFVITFLIGILFLTNRLFLENAYANTMLIQSLAFKGNSVFSQQELESIIQTKEGMDFDRSLLEKDLETILMKYHKEGYIFARIEPAIRTFPNGIYLMLEIDEGIIGLIEVKGYQKGKEEVIKRELLFEVGSIYNYEDELESERILRRKQSLGKAEIIAVRNENTERIEITVEVIVLWTLFPSISLPIFDDKNSDIILAISDTNIFGFGQKVKLRYKHPTDSDSEDSLSGSFIEPRLFGTHSLLHCDFAEKFGHASWNVALVRPFYSLKTNWSAEFLVSERFNEKEWFSPESSKVLENVICNEDIRFSKITRSFGKRKSQFRLSLWSLMQDKKFEHEPVYANYENKTINMVGLSFSRAKVNFIKETYLNKLGRIEDIQLGYNYGISTGYASKLAGSDENELKLMLHTIYSQKYGERNFVDFSFNLETSRILGDYRNTIAVINIRYFLKDIFKQTFAFRFASKLGYNLKTEQIILNTSDGVRGYNEDKIVGTKIFLLNVEDRMILFKHPLIVIGSVIFADIGFIPKDSRNILKRSVGIGIRVGIPKLSGSPVYRIDLAYPLDDSKEFSFARSFYFSIGHLF